MTKQTSHKGALVTLLVVQIIIGYEWLVSGITKIASGTFVSGLADNLRDSSTGASHWYGTFLRGSIIPNAHTFAVLIEAGELAIGTALLLASILWLFRGEQRFSLWMTVLAALGATFMAINFHLASGDNHPWLIPADGFDETIDVDMVLTMIQLAFVSFGGYRLLKMRGPSRKGR